MDTTASISLDRKVFVIWYVFERQLKEFFATEESVRFAVQLYRAGKEGGQRAAI